MIGLMGMAAEKAIGTGLGMLAGKMQDDQNKAMQQRQAELNEKMAQANQQRNKEMWDYTNYENQRKHMEAAGLNPALMYGQGGGGGSSASGAQAQGVGMVQSSKGQMAMQGAQMGMQMAQIQAQTKALEADAELKKAQAEKTAGVDTEAVKTGIDNVLAITQNEYQKQHLIRADTELKETETKLKEGMTGLVEGQTGQVQANINKMVWETERLKREIDGLNIDNEVKEKTKEDRIKQVSLTLENIGAEIFVKQTQGKVNQEQAKAIVENVKQGWANYGLGATKNQQGWMNLEQEATKIYNQIKIQQGGLELQDSQLTKDWIIGIGKLFLEAKRSQ